MPHAGLVNKLRKFFRAVLKSGPSANHIFFSGITNRQRLDWNTLSLRTSQGGSSYKPDICLVCPIRWARLIAWLSTSGCHTGSQKMTRDADTRFLYTNISYQYFHGERMIRYTYSPRAPCFNSIRNTRYVSEVSKLSKHSTNQQRTSTRTDRYKLTSTQTAHELAWVHVT